MWCLLRAYDQFLFCLTFFLFLNFQPNLSSSLFPSCSPHETASLLQFKSSFSVDKFYSSHCDFIETKSYPKTDSWKVNTDCCSWDGVSCDNITSHVIGLDLSCSWLHGTIPWDSSLFHLQHLQNLNLAFNNFNDSILSSKFGEFPSLVYLNLSASSFSGQVPSQISHLSKLVSLDRSGNDFEPLEEQTLKGLVHKLTELRELVLDYIDMSFINPYVFMNLSSSLRSLSLFRCHMRAKFPENFFYRPNLRSLILGDNGDLGLNLNLKLNVSTHLQLLDLQGINMSLSREFVHSIGNLQSLKYLYLSYTSFHGGFPDSITNLTALELLEASYADISGRLPDSIGNLVSLRHLSLPSSQLWGSIPRSLGKLSQLRYVELSGNYFSGHIPSSLTDMTQLEFLSLRENQLEGSIPDEVTAKFPNLISLDLSLNLLNGSLPSWLFKSSSLKEIHLSENQLSGDIKEFRSKSLEWVDLKNNKLQGPIPFSIFQQMNLTDLSISSNSLSGIVEFGMFSKLQNLEVLDLSCNSLSLNFNGASADDYPLPNLQSLYLASCNVSEFPQFLRGSKGLMSLDLSNNRIYGKLPGWIWDAWKDSLISLNLSHNSLTNFEQLLPWKSISYLDLSFNLIHGDLPIPTRETYGFFLSNNSFNGEISSLICNATSLKILDLSHNNLSGTIPKCFLENLSKSLLFMSLGSNKLHGIISPTFTEGCQLRNIELNGNQLEGPLTPSISNCTSLEVLDLGNNKFNDTFPYWLGDLPKLEVLVLRSNQLHGSIQDTSSGLSFSKIQIFDISNNYFSGPLPVRYIKNFKSMINLTKDESAGSYMGVQYFDIFNSYSIEIAIKGQQNELVKVFTKFATLDLSNNKFQGKIPTVIGKLKSIRGLNLSHNNLSGGIPTSIGNLVNLEWLDLSSNKLIGIIPEQLLDLTYLSIFNVSENQLHGRIPQGKQLATFENTSYEGNKGLCGFPLSKGCSNNESPPPSEILEEEVFPFGWKVVLIGYGCGVVFGLIVGFVVFQTGKPNWLLNFVEDLHPNNKKKKKTSRGSNGRRI